MLSAGEAHETRALYGSARHCCGPARGFDGPDHGPAHMFFVIKVKAYALTCFFFHFFFRFFSPSGFRGPPHEPHTCHLPTQSRHNNGPLRWLPSRLVDNHLLRHPQQQQPQQQHLLCCCNTCSLLLQYGQHLLLSKLSFEGSNYNARDCLAAASYATAAILIPGATTTHERERRCNFRSEHVPCVGQLDEVLPGGSVRTEPGKNVKCWLRHGDGKECALYTHNAAPRL